MTAPPFQRAIRVQSIRDCIGGSRPPRCLVQAGRIVQLQGVRQDISALRLCQQLQPSLESNRRVAFEEYCATTLQVAGGAGLPVRRGGWPSISGT